MPRRNPSAKARYAIDLVIILGVVITYEGLVWVLGRRNVITFYLPLVAAVIFAYGCYSVTGRFIVGIFKEEKRILPYPAETILSAVPKIAEQLKWAREPKYETSVRPPFNFAFKTKGLLGMMMTFPFMKHQLMGIRATRITEASSEVHVMTQAPLVADYGQNSGTIKRFFSALEKYLK